MALGTFSGARQLTVIQGICERVPAAISVYKVSPVHGSRGRESEQDRAKADELVVEPSRLPFIRSLKGCLDCAASRAMRNTFKANEFFPSFGEIGGSDLSSGLGNIRFRLRPPAGDDLFFQLDVTRPSRAKPGCQRISVILR